MAQHVFIGTRCIYCYTNNLDADIYNIDCVDHEPLAYSTDGENIEHNLADKLPKDLGPMARVMLRDNPETWAQFVELEEDSTN